MLALIYNQNNAFHVVMHLPGFKSGKCILQQECIGLIFNQDKLDRVELIALISNQNEEYRSQYKMKYSTNFYSGK